METRTQVVQAHRAPHTPAQGSRKEKCHLGQVAPTVCDPPPSLQTLYGVYYKCPCERGLTCDVDKTIVGSITNTNFGVCLDLGRAAE